MFKLHVLSAALVVSLSGTAAVAQPAMPAAQKPVAAPPRTIALVAAVGDQFTRVRQKQQVGSHLENFTRDVVQMPDQSLNMAVLRGLDKAVAADEPNSRRVLLALTVEPEAEKVLPVEREQRTLAKLTQALKDMPQRQEWDEIIAVTPKWLLSERQGMGGKLSGIGLYVQPLENNLRSITSSSLQTSGSQQNVETPDREDTKSSVYVAPYFYVIVTTFDAKTMRVIKSEARHDYRKMYDPKSTAIDVEKSFSPEQMAEAVTDFVETSTLRAVSKADRSGNVEVRQPKEVPQQK
jgi:hypothetical protein